MFRDIVLLLLFTILVFARDDVNLVAGKAYISSKDKGLQYRMINRGYIEQLSGLMYKLRDNNVLYKYYRDDYKYFKPQNKMIIDKEKRVGEEFYEMLKSVNSYFESHDADKTKTKKKTLSDENDNELDFSETDFKRVSKSNGKINDKYKTLFEDAMRNINNIYRLGQDENRYLFPFYYENGDFIKATPNLVFMEYFNPNKRGRRYFLKINVFVFIIDSDGYIKVMAKEIKDFRWKRNWRFITAQTGAVIKELLARNGVEIR